MLNFLITSMFAVTTFAQLPELNQFSEIIQNINDVQTCSDCYITLCDNTITLPADIITCENLNTELAVMKTDLFKQSKDCQGKANNYMCEVFVTPFSKLTKSACSNNNFDDELLEEVYEESFCQSNDNCEDLSRCSMYNFECDYDSDVLPFIGLPPSNFDEGEYPHNDFDEKLKRFFKDNGRVIITVVSTNLLLIIIISLIVCCCRKVSCRSHRTMRQRNNDVEIV